MKTGTVYKTDGSVLQVEPKNGESFSLEELRGFVGGYIDIQQLPKSKEIMVLNDEGKLAGLPKNDAATAVWKKAYPIADYQLNNDELIVGDVLVCASSLVQ